MSLGQFADDFSKRDNVTNRKYALPGATITVRNEADTADVALFTDDTGTVSLANPLPTGVAPGEAGLDGAGNGMFWCEAQKVTIHVDHPSVDTPWSTQVRIDADGSSSDTGSVSFTRVAATVLSAIRTVVPTPAGTVEYADASNLAHRDLPMWVTTTAAAAGQPVTVVAYGPVDNPGAGWTPGSPLFLTTAGVLSHAAPTALAFAFACVVGVAESTARLFVEPQTEVALVP